MRTRFLTVLMLFIALFSAAVFAQGNLTCVYNQSQCQAGYTTVLRLSNGTDGHAELPSVFNYNVSLCCKESVGATVIGTGASGTTFLKLSNTTDAHVERGNLSVYGTSAYISSSAGTISCDYPDVAGVCAANYACLATISNNTDAQTANCTAGAAYTSTVCCKLTITAEEAAASSGGGGSGGGDSGCQADWECSDWDLCNADGFQYRTCTDLNECAERPNVRYTTPAEPTENRTCNFTYEPSCSDGILNNDETGIDCGGSCLACSVGSSCSVDNDCVSANCLQGACRNENVDCVSDDNCSLGFACRDSLCLLSGEEPRRPAGSLGEGIVNMFKASAEKVSDTGKAVFGAVKSLFGGYGGFALAVLVTAGILFGGYFVYRNYLGYGLYHHVLARRAARYAGAEMSTANKAEAEREKEAQERAKALVVYIRSAALKGYAAKDIQGLLVSKGWPAESVYSYIDYVFKKYEGELKALKEASSVQDYDEEIRGIDEKLKGL